MSTINSAAHIQVQYSLKTIPPFITPVEETHLLPSAISQSFSPQPSSTMYRQALRLRSCATAANTTVFTEVAGSSSGRLFSDFPSSSGASGSEAAERPATQHVQPTESQAESASSSEPTSQLGGFDAQESTGLAGTLNAAASAAASVAAAKESTKQESIDKLWDRVLRTP